VDYIEKKELRMKFIIDLDGTLLSNQSLNKYGDDFISYLQEKAYDFLIMTNSIQSPVHIQKRLKKVGIAVLADKIFNPIVAINETIRKYNYKKALIVGSQEEITSRYVFGSDRARGDYSLGFLKN
jgi:ribonucleotide monophosphatase NagD (HAD superfamily)